jgi:3-oxoacyl-[acyl-carrier-protein] synthase II
MIRRLHRETARARAPVAVTAWGLHLPGVCLDHLLLAGAGPRACPPEDAHTLLGSKGLLNKDSATRLALCAVHHALHRAPLAPRTYGSPDPTVAVVASSNYCNFSTVQAVVRTIRTTGLHDVSALDAPNASSNVLASTVAIWFRFGGPNLMLCSGSTSGLDAVFLGCALLRSGRADRVVVVGAEPADASAEQFHASRARIGRALRLRGGAAALVLQLADDVEPRPPILEAIDDGVASAVAGATPPAIAIGPAARVPQAGRVIDLETEIGDTYGAQGVLQVAVGCALVSAAPRGAAHAVIICGDEADGWRSTILRHAGVPSRVAALSQGRAV